MRKIGNQNTTYNIKDCLGTVTTTVDKFVSETDFDKSQGPYLATSEVTVPPCGMMGMHIYTDVANDATGCQDVLHHPASVFWRDLPFGHHVFPLLARGNPASAAAFNADNTRLTDSAYIISFDNRHSLRISWPAVDTTDAHLLDAVWASRYTMHEVVYWIPDIKTVELNGLVSITADCDTVAEAQVQLRKMRTWSRRMYNAYFVNHPVLDDGTADVPTSLLDVIDIVTGPPTTAFDCYNEPLHVTAANRALQITDDNLLPGWRDTKEYMAAGVYERRKDAKPVWNRKKVFRRPRTPQYYQGAAVHEDAAGGASMNQMFQRVRAGRRFMINKKMVWEKQTADSAPDSAIREVCPRGCYFYQCYWYFQSNAAEGAFQARANLIPNVSLDFTKHVDKTMVLRWNP